MTRRRLATVVDEQTALDGFSRVRVAMVLTDPRADDNPIVYVNAAFERTTGYERSAVIGRNCRFLQGDRTEKADVDALRGAIAASEDVTVDIVNYRADGEPFTNRLIVAPIHDARGEVIYFLGIQKELHPSERERDELGDLLRKIRGRVAGDLSEVLDGLDDGLDDPDPAHRYGQLHRRLGCLQQVYEAMRLADDQRPAAARARIDLGALLSRIATGIAHEDSQPGIRYVQAIERIDAGADAAVRVSLLLSEVLSNAFAHAFDRMDEGLVECRVTQLAAGGLRVTVTDDGVGLPAGALYPDPGTMGGRLIARLLAGLDATLSPVRGAAGTVVVIDVPVDAVTN
ncbi:PAS domain-containing protein [Jannaschia sp. LMIT008]|uniref:PAS domain-containing protein n=1 Tax=Jannaschia maritima TaxID=3032585 RepID=UPI00281198AD|nr:PAS domain-containing protein [Jannaschia sp. LMIT008]